MLGDFHGVLCLSQPQHPNSGFSAVFAQLCVVSGPPHRSVSRVGTFNTVESCKTKYLATLQTYTRVIVFVGHSLA